MLIQINGGQEGNGEGIGANEDGHQPGEAARGGQEGHGEGIGANEDGSQPGEAAHGGRHPGNENDDVGPDIIDGVGDGSVGDGEVIAEEIASTNFSPEGEVSIFFESISHRMSHRSCFF